MPPDVSVPIYGDGFTRPPWPGFPPLPAPLPTVTGPPDAWMGFDPDRRPRWGIGDVFLGLAGWIVAQVLAVVALTVIGVTDTITLALVTLPIGWIALVGYLVILTRLKGYGSLRRDFGFRFRWVDPFMGFSIGLLILFVSFVVRVAVAKAFGEEPTGNADAIFGDVQSNRYAVLAMAAMAAIGAPIVEELFFRGLALRAFEKRWAGAVVGVCCSSLLFALLHFQAGTVASALSLIAGIFVYGASFAVMARATGRLGPSIFAHMTINGLASAYLVFSAFSNGAVG